MESEDPVCDCCGEEVDEVCPDCGYCPPCADEADQHDDGVCSKCDERRKEV